MGITFVFWSANNLKKKPNPNPKKTKEYPTSNLKNQFEVQIQKKNHPKVQKRSLKTKNVQIQMKNQLKSKS